MNKFLSQEQTTQEETGYHLIKSNYVIENLLVPDEPVGFSIFQLYIIYRGS